MSTKVSTKEGEYGTIIFEHHDRAKIIQELPQGSIHSYHGSAGSGAQELLIHIEQTGGKVANINKDFYFAPIDVAATYAGKKPDARVFEVVSRNHPRMNDVFGTLYIPRGPSQDITCLRVYIPKAILSAPSRGDKITAIFAAITLTGVVSVAIADEISSLVQPYINGNKTGQVQEVSSQESSEAPKDKTETPVSTSTSSAVCERAAEVTTSASHNTTTIFSLFRDSLSRLTSHFTSHKGSEGTSIEVIDSDSPEAPSSPVYHASSEPSSPKEPVSPVSREEYDVIGDGFITVSTSSSTSTDEESSSAATTLTTQLNSVCYEDSQAGY